MKYVTHVLLLLGVGLLMLNAYLMMRTALRSSGNCEYASKTYQTAGEKVGPEKSSYKFVHNFSALHKSFKRMQDGSIYRVQADTLMPLLRLSEAEKNRDYRVRLGKLWMRSQTVVFVGTARNAKAHMPRNAADIHRLGKMFKDYWMVFVENDSNDGTRAYLHTMRDAYNKTVILGCEPINSKAECHLGIVYRSGQMHRPGWAQKRTLAEKEDRSATMSILRNMYLDYIYAHLADTADLMIAIEPDLSWDEWNLDNIVQGLYYFSNRPTLDSVCANGRLWGKLYDPCSRTYFHRKRFNAVPEDDHKFTTDAMALEKNTIPIKVESCFQGFAVYRISSLDSKKLHYYTAPDELNCEHNTLARRLEENYIDPEMRLNIYSLVVHSMDKW